MGSLYLMWQYAINRRKVECMEDENKVEKTVEERVNEAVAKLNAEWQQKWDNELTTTKNATAKSVREAEEKKFAREKLTVEERAKAEWEEKYNNLATEAEELRKYRKTTTLKEKLSGAKLPQRYLYDVRLVNAEDGKEDAIIKDLAKEHEAEIAQYSKSNQNSTEPFKSGNQKQDNEILENLKKKAGYLKL